MTVTGIFGVPGAGLENQDFARNIGTAKAGAKFEKRTAKVLNELSKQCAVLHDVRIPLAGVKANMDHIVVAGKHVMLIDTKGWSKGFYWTLPGLGTFHGVKRALYVDKPLSMAHNAFGDLLRADGEVSTPTIAVWGSDGDVNVRHVRVVGANVIEASTLRTAVRKFVLRHGEGHADRQVVQKLLPFVVKS
ncbi:nuclease-related domain-containing protein [Glutamicibacter sp. 363]|uniref:nuclease-related domain-containing protein n=1 Tax=Glutamicibacter sp. 363 TaxID=3457731 RepID=UPI004034BA45